MEKRNTAIFQAKNDAVYRSAIGQQKSFNCGRIYLFDAGQWRGVNGTGSVNTIVIPNNNNKKKKKPNRICRNVCSFTQ